jgi:hypothetical protein
MPKLDNRQRLGLLFGLLTIVAGIGLTWATHKPVVIGFLGQSAIIMLFFRKRGPARRR